MPSFKSSESEDFKVSLKPLGIRKLFYKASFNLPYFTGSNFEANLIIETTSGEPREFAYKWWLNSGEQQRTRVNEDSKSFLGTKRIVECIRAPMLSDYGHHILKVRLTYPIGSSMAEWETRIADFHVIERDNFTIRILMVLLPLICGAIGGIIGWVIHSLVR